MTNPWIWPCQAPGMCAGKQVRQGIRGRDQDLCYNYSLRGQMVHMSHPKGTSLSPRLIPSFLSSQQPALSKPGGEHGCGDDGKLPPKPQLAVPKEHPQAKCRKHMEKSISTCLSQTLERLKVSTGPWQGLFPKLWIKWCSNLPALNPVWDYVIFLS